jgi:hypothetical protein
MGMKVEKDTRDQIHLVAKSISEDDYPYHKILVTKPNSHPHKFLFDINNTVFLG